MNANLIARLEEAIADDQRLEPDLATALESAKTLLADVNACLNDEGGLVKVQKRRSDPKHTGRADGGSGGTEFQQIKNELLALQKEHTVRQKKYQDAFKKRMQQVGNDEKAKVSSYQGP